MSLAVGFCFSIFMSLAYLSTGLKVGDQHKLLQSHLHVKQSLVQNGPPLPLPHPLRQPGHVARDVRHHRAPNPKVNPDLAPPNNHPGRLLHLNLGSRPARLREVPRDRLRVSGSSGRQWPRGPRARISLQSRRSESPAEVPLCKKRKCLRSLQVNPLLPR